MAVYLEYIAGFILIWIALGYIKRWYFCCKLNGNRSYPFGIDNK